MKMKLLPQGLYKSIYNKVPRVCVDLIIRSRNGVVLVKRGGHDLGPGRGKWHLPGKTILYREGVKDAIKRVAADETGLKVRVRKFIGFHDYGTRVTFGHPISLVFLVDAVGGRLHDREGRGIRFFKRLPKNIGFGQRKILEEAGFR